MNEKKIYRKCRLIENIFNNAHNFIPKWTEECRKQQQNKLANLFAIFREWILQSTGNSTNSPQHN